MRSVSPGIYDKKFFKEKCLGSAEFNSSNGRKLHKNVMLMLNKINVKKSMTVLDLGCGRGDITYYISKKAKMTYGIDYAKDAIFLANKLRSGLTDSEKKKLNYIRMNSKNLLFPKNTFDLVICIDMFEHLYPEELNIALAQIKKVLKKDGVLFVHTCTNKTLYDFTYKYYIRPINVILTKADALIRNKIYSPLPLDPRIEEEKIQHVNEPTYFYLKKIFSKFKFSGKIGMEIGYLKNENKLSSKIYNFICTLYPISKIFPLNILFSWAFICNMKNNKP